MFLGKGKLNVLPKSCQQFNSMPSILGSQLSVFFPSPECWVFQREERPKRRKSLYAALQILPFVLDFHHNTDNTMVDGFEFFACSSPRIRPIGHQSPFSTDKMGASPDSILQFSQHVHRNSKVSGFRLLF